MAGRRWIYLYTSEGTTFESFLNSSPFCHLSNISLMTAMLPLYLFSLSTAACFHAFLTPHQRTRWLLRSRAGGGASLWSRSRSNSLPVETAGGGGRRGDLSSVHGSGLGRLLTMSSSPSLGSCGEGDLAVGACDVLDGSFRIQALHTG